MPLLDHFHPPLSLNHRWESFNAVWVVELVGWLNQLLPRDEYQAFAQIHLGSKVEADVAEFADAGGGTGSRNGATVATLPAVAAPAATIPAFFPDEFEVQIQDRIGNLLLAG